MKQSANLSVARRVSLAIISISIALAGGRDSAASPPRFEQDGTIHVPAFDLPQSTFLSQDLRAMWEARDLNGLFDPLTDGCLRKHGEKWVNVPSVRKCVADRFYQTPFYKRVRSRYDVVVTREEFGGIHAEVFRPARGVAPKNEKRVLINLHGGAFLDGAGTLTHVESIPIASVGQIKVISIDYRMAPPNRFPAASEDVAIVYRELLKSYAPKNIGLYGCSAGGLLTAEAVAWFQRERLPAPGAVGMFCGAASFWGDGDSGHFGAALEVSPPDWMTDSRKHPYFRDTDTNDPLAFPLRSVRVITDFPPSLLISSTRDLALSSVVQTHSQLIQHGVEADLYVWEGLGHAFFYDSELPQSREVYEVVARFFDKHLGSGTKPGY